MINLLTYIHKKLNPCQYLQVQDAITQKNYMFTFTVDNLQHIVCVTLFDDNSNKISSGAAFFNSEEHLKNEVAELISSQWLYKDY